MLALNNVCKNYNGHKVLNKVSLKVAKAEVAGLLGPSGCGKSTILKLLAGLTAPNSGSVVTGSRKIGFVFQKHRLIPWKTALENVSLGLMAAGKGRMEAQAIARNYIERVELSDFADYLPSQLSGGMCQRVSIARAFAVHPDILLMDEPFASLDSDLKQTLIEFVKDMLRRQQDLTVLYVTHDPVELTSLAHTLYRFSGNGRFEKNITK